jgi:DNA topoisomerase IA
MTDYIHKKKGKIMVTDKGILIIEPAKDKEEICKKIAVSALSTMTDVLVEMEQMNLPEKTMMQKCVWPILNEAAKRFKDVQDNKEVKIGNFVYVVGK